MTILLLSLVLSMGYAPGSEFRKCVKEGYQRCRNLGEDPTTSECGTEVLQSCVKHLDGTDVETEDKRGHND